MLIIFFSVAEDEVCGSKIGDENPKNCCPPGAIELLIARFLKLADSLKNFGSPGL